VNVIPGVFFARGGAKPADASKPAPAETEAATPPEVTSFRSMCLINKPLPTSWWSHLTRSTFDDIGEVSVGADSVTFKSWSKTLEIRLSDIESVRLDTPGLPWGFCVILQYRTADGGSDEVGLRAAWSRHQSRQLHDAIAARLAARR
jgi:hypothetical protein